MSTPPTYFSISLSPSLWLLIYSIVLHILAVLAVSYFSVLGRLQGLLQLCLITALCIFIYQHYYVKRCAIERILYKHQVWTIFVLGKSNTVVLRQATVWSWLQVLNFCDELTGRSYTAIIGPTSVAANDVKQLKVILRHHVDWAPQKLFRR